MEIVTLGELILDMFASESGKDFFSVTAFLPVAGGAPANVAVAAARLGVKSAFIGKVGEDPFGHRLEAVLKGYGVETRGMRFDKRYRTTLNFMTIPDPHRTEMLFYRNPGADMLLEPGELDEELIEGSAVYHFGSVSLAIEPCRSAAIEAAMCARKAGALVSFDVNYRPPLGQRRTGKGRDRRGDNHGGYHQGERVRAASHGRHRRCAGRLPIPRQARTRSLRGHPRAGRKRLGDPERALTAFPGSR